MRRRTLLASLVAAVSGAACVVFAACGGEEDARPAASKDAGSDAALIGETTPPVPDAEPPPGDVCGIRGGLSAASPWPLRGGCATRAGYASTSGPQNATVAFSTPLAGGESAPAVGDGGFTWLGTLDGRILAVTSAGAVRWAARTASPVRASPAVDADGRAIVGGEDGFLYSFAMEDAVAEADGGVDAAIGFGDCVFHREGVEE
ncbi:MAG TPA: PQQ-binding-like beta-propeller repeat protein, partial [Gaiellaceae bacterium]|nr:PQQ-binding-like beta-propeller repeat protein [Gaiellaceae bacterium]